MAVDALQPFVAKWQAREPEMAVAEVFCPVPLRPRFQAWGVLLHELREALFELSDPRVTGIKTGWWAEEMMGLEQGRSRHPVTEGFASMRGPWSALGRSLLDATALEVRPASTAEAIESLQPLALSIVSVEAVVFGAPAGDSAARALVVHWLLSRLPAGLEMQDQGRIPMHLFARHGVSPGQSLGGQDAALLHDWAGDLLDALPTIQDGALFRRARTTFDRARLSRLSRGKGYAPPLPLATLWRAWRAARGHQSLI